VASTGIETTGITRVIKVILRRQMGTIVSANTAKLAAYMPWPHIKGSSIFKDRSLKEN
jgi:hypothetical protein